MAIRHIGFGLVDKNGKPVIGPGDSLAFDDMEKIMNKYAFFQDRDEPQSAPHKVVRVLIDDGAEG